MAMRALTWKFQFFSDMKKHAQFSPLEVAVVFVERKFSIRTGGILGMMVTLWKYEYQEGKNE
jgi:hypothetical protein